MRKLFKKSLACVLAVALCLTAMVGVLTVSAADAIDGTIAIADVTIEAGSTEATIPVTFTVTGEEADLINTGYINLEVVGATVTRIYDSVGDLDTNADKTLFEIWLDETGDGGSKEALVNIVVAIAEGTESFTVKAYNYTSATNTEKLINFGEAEKTFTIEEPVVEHQHVLADAVIENNVPATCYAGGSYDSVVYCTAEGCDLENNEYSRETITVPATGEHTPAEPVEENRVEPDCDTAGSYDSVVYCSVAECKHEISRTTVTIDALGHTDDNQDGICDICGYENLDESLALYSKGILLGADIRGILQVRKMKDTSPYDSFKVIAEKIDGTVSELELVATSDKTNHITYGYAVTVPAKEMADIIKARIVGITAEGEAFISNVETWSIKEGVISSMDTYSTQTSEAYVNRVKLCANMLNYGAEAQKNFNYQLDNLATDGLSEEYAAYIITTTPEMETIAATDDTGATAPLKDIRFNLAARVQILPRFTVSSSDVKEDYYAEITQVHTAPDGTETTKEFTIDGANCLKSGTTFAVYVDNLASKELRDVLTVTLYKNGEAVSATHTFSAESVLVGMLETKGSLVAALMNYGDCARAVFG